uniref:MAD2L1 binding protein n=2 Tax=Latimeria chalumnae TaxID=7897 RepID=H3A6E1_LATCH
MAAEAGGEASAVLTGRTARGDDDDPGGQRQPRSGRAGPQEKDPPGDGDPAVGQSSREEAGTDPEAGVGPAGAQRVAPRGRWGVEEEDADPGGQSAAFGEEEAAAARNQLDPLSERSGSRAWVAGPVEISHGAGTDVTLSDHGPQAADVKEQSDWCNSIQHQPCLDSKLPTECPPRGVVTLRRRSSEDRSLDGCSIPVVFPGHVTQDSCCKFVCEVFKHVLYQRQQLPLPYEQLLYFQRKQQLNQNEEVVKKSRWFESGDKKSQKVLLELKEIFVNLETLFSLTLVPRVLILLGGSVICPKELYEINMEGISLGNGEQSLKTDPCVRKLFHTLFVSDAFSDLKSVPAASVVVMVQAHRDCGIEWFRPKMNYKVPSRGKRLSITLLCSNVQADSTLKHRIKLKRENYVWFQAPVAIKGFHY